jgi:hypothetical protein
MATRLSLAFLVLGAAVTAALGQSSGAVAPPASAQDKPAQDVQIVLEARSLTLNGNLEERAGADFKLPAPGKCIVQEQKQTKLLLRLASGDRRSNAGPLKTVVVPSGEEREFSPFGRSQSLQGHDVIVATADNRQTINIKLTWAKSEDGSEHLPVTTAAVPPGSNLLICTTEYLASGAVVVSAWQKFQDRLLNRKRPTLWREKQRVYVLISPRVTVPEEQQQPPAAR